MSKKIFLLLALTVLIGRNNNQIFAMDSNITDSTPLDLEKTSIFDNVRSWSKEQYSKFRNWMQSEYQGNTIVSNEQETTTIQSEQLSTESTSVHATEITVTNEQGSNVDILVDNTLRQETGHEVEKQPEEALSSKMVGISFDRKKLLCFGAGAVALIVIGYCTYVLYDNGTLKKVGTRTKQFVQEHKVGITSVVAVTIVLAIVGICAKHSNQAAKCVN